MKVRVEFLSDCLDGFYTDILKLCHQLFVDTVHTVYKRIFFGFLGNRCQTSFKIIYYRKDLLDHTLGTGIEHRLFLFIGSLTEVLKLCHLTLYSVFQLIDLLLVGIFLFVQFCLLLCCLFVFLAHRLLIFCLFFQFFGIRKILFHFFL